MAQSPATASRASSSSSRLRRTPVLQAAAIFVEALVQPGQQEMMGQGHIMSSIGIDDIEAGRFGAPDRVAMPAPERPDIAFVHRPGLHRIDAVVRHVRRRQRDHPA